MTKTFSTKLDAQVLQLLDNFCKRHHLKKSYVLAEILKEGIQRREETLRLAASIQKGLEDEKEGNLYTTDQVERTIFGKKKAG